VVVVAADFTLRHACLQVTGVASMEQEIRLHLPSQRRGGTALLKPGTES
jgi:hypothetical protein